MARDENASAACDRRPMRLARARIEPSDHRKRNGTAGQASSGTRHSAMDASHRKKLGVIGKYAVENFSEGDWYALGQLTGQIDYVESHRLLRALSFGDDDYTYCVAQVLDHIAEKEPDAVNGIIEHFDIDIWYEQRHPDKYRKLFISGTGITPDFWKDGYLKTFVSHLSSGRSKVSRLKAALEEWGMSAFIAHDDIKPSREWQREIEAALESMELLIAFIEPGFAKSDWTDQEVGYALGRRVEVIPIRVGQDPHGFIGKIQGVQAKGKVPHDVAESIVELLLRKPNFRPQLLRGITRSVALISSDNKTAKIRKLDSWSVLTDKQTKDLLERASLSEDEKHQLRDIITKAGAFQITVFENNHSDDIPF